MFTAARSDIYGQSYSKYAIDSAKSAVVRLLNMAVDVSKVVTNLDQVSEHLSSDARNRLQHLSVQVTTASFQKLIPLLLTTPNLHSLELRLTGEARQTDTVLDALLDKYDKEYDGTAVLPDLRSLKLDYPDISGAILALAELFAPTLKTLELHIGAYRPNFAAAKPKDPTGFIEEFPALTDLTLSGDIDALRGPLASISDDLFPVLKHLRHLPTAITAYSARRQGEPKITTSVRKNSIDRISAYNLVGPVYQKKASVSLPTDSLVTAPPLYPSLLGHVAEPAASDLPSRKRDLRETLQFLLDCEARADAQGDTALLLRLASALSRVELERIVHEA